MEVKFAVQQRELGLSECERLCCRPSRDIEELASRAGWRGLSGQLLSVSLGTALNMLVLSIASSHGIAPESMAAWLPGLRDEALLHLGVNTSNWSFEGAYEEEKQFWPILYGTPDAIRPRIAPLLGCYSHSTTSVLRVFSPTDVERVSSCGSQRGASDRTPRFTIVAHALAEQMKGTLGSPLFTAKVASFSRSHL
jgi:hypothetical protein